MNCRTVSYSCDFDQHGLRHHRFYRTDDWRVKLALVEREIPKVKRRKTPWVVGTLMVVSLATLIILQSTNLWKEFTIDSSSDLILLYALSSLNFIAFVIFGFIFLRSIIKLVRERRTFELGAQIKTRLFIYFAAVSLLPILAMASFSYLFLNRALDRWFSQIPQSVIQQARNLEQQSVNNSLAELERLGREQQTIRRIALLTLGVLTFLLMFASSWIAFYVARGLTTPIKALAEGASEIAAGNFGHRVDVFAEDELALLVTTFNDMSAKLESNSVELGERRKYIETLLETLPTGVVSFDAVDRVSTINRAAANILRLDGADFAGVELDDLVSEDSRDIFKRLVGRARRVGHASDQTTLKGESLNYDSTPENELTVAITATKLPSDDGVVLVIEDLSELISAQRASAWQEVARRMAHEIKNPLTPIQLSAERIAKRFTKSGHTDNGLGKRINDKGPIGDVVHESTETILREVTSLKTMVDEFSRFARLPDTKLENGDLNAVIDQAIMVFDSSMENVEIETALVSDLPQVYIDAEQMKSVFVNLIGNAVEAFESATPERTIWITTRHDTARDLIVAEVSDNGKGIAPADLQKLFQPYFSTKGRGTGLGLAIVNRIISEHHGRIKAVANQPKGAKFIIELPTQTDKNEVD
ncbi:MAG: HAMP domain-containing protein [Chloracidobacterium sp.]|nr:HAMP domain-containing protein [Chloracidobacterium sp.]